MLADFLTIGAHCLLANFFCEAYSLQQGFHEFLKKGIRFLKEGTIILKLLDKRLDLVECDRICRFAEKMVCEHATSLICLHESVL